MTLSPSHPLTQYPTPCALTGAIPLPAAACLFGARPHRPPARAFGLVFASRLRPCCSDSLGARPLRAARRSAPPLVLRPRLPLRPSRPLRLRGRRLFSAPAAASSFASLASPLRLPSQAAPLRSCPPHAPRLVGLRQCRRLAPSSSLARPASARAPTARPRAPLAFRLRPCCGGSARGYVGRLAARAPSPRAAAASAPLLRPRPSARLPSPLRLPFQPRPLAVPPRARRGAPDHRP